MKAVLETLNWVDKNPLAEGQELVDVRSKLESIVVPLLCGEAALNEDLLS